ncbi:hypothetical protein [Chromobacterium sphagni]|uniref:hypothetical protein n=1 Tax=Chromobacterium sphagni TaxID=1903179 RepID=UPI001F4EBD4C|nr:hypothetical protein [Chromobacterium sphagni]
MVYCKQSKCHYLFARRLASHTTMLTPVRFLIGVDGGGTGTRVLVAAADGKPLAQAEGPGSALSLGIEKAWQTILNTLGQAFAQLDSPCRHTATAGWESACPAFTTASGPNNSSRCLPASPR